MGYIRRPAYYKAFRCIGSDCTENCCIGWEIDVDEDSLAYYETVPGDFGERLRASIAPADAQTGEPAHFRLDAEERCPLLNDCNLCEVLLHLGEGKMAQICTDHPRYYEWFSDGREDGLGLCCEAAAELILAQTGAPAFDVTEADGVSETGTEAETELENVLFSMRDALFRLACEDAPFDDKADRLYRTAKAQQEQAYNTWQNAVLSAGSEVSNALVLYNSSAEKSALEAKQVESLQKNVEYAKMLFSQGQGTTYLEVITAQQSLLNAQLSKVADDFYKMQAVVNLYYALGGGRN